MSYRSAVILRIARARVRHGHEEHVLDVLRQMTNAMGTIPGLRSAEFGRTLSGDDMWLVVITRWDDIDSIRAVYGDSWPSASILPGSEEYILDTVLEHFEVTLEELTEVVAQRAAHGSA